MNEGSGLSGARCVLVGDELEEATRGRLAALGPDGPKALYVLGDPGALAGASAAVIGARRATPYGLSCARLAARSCARMGLGVVSGAAVGCDQTAQAEGLRQGARSVAVLGGGADVIYPRSSARLLEDVLAGGGAVVSERPWGAPPERWAFLRRNRLIAALSDLLVVCEAGKRSGTFSTAEAAQAMGRDVLVFPGPFFSENSWGANHLIQSGAQCLCDEEDLEMAVSRACGSLRFSDEPVRRDPSDVPGLTSRERDVLRAVCACPTRAQELADAFATDVVVMMRILGALQVRGLAERLVDGRYSPTQLALARSYARAGEEGSPAARPRASRDV